MLFFSPRALNRVKEYLTRRKDQGEALFVVGRRGRPMRLQAALVRFRRFRRMIHFPKPVTAHMLRHYLPFLTMSSDIGQRSAEADKIESQRGRTERTTRHSLVDPTGC